MYRIIVVILLLAQALALQVTGSIETITLAPSKQERNSVQVFNDASQKVEVTAAYYLDKAPDNTGVSLRLSAETFTLGGQGSRDYSWQVTTADTAEPGEYLFWLVFSTDIHTQNTESGDFVVQDTAYFPIRLIVENNNN